MSKKLEIIINGKDNLSGPVKQGEKSLHDLSQAASATGVKTDGLWKQMAGGAVVAQAVTAGITAMARSTVDFVKDSIAAYNVQEKAETQLAAVLRSTKSAAGVTAGEMKNLASSLQGVTAYGDEAIIGAENILLTFTKIGKTVIPEATETILDMSQALGQDLKQTAIQVGKALQEPVQGVSALRRVGVQLTDSQEAMVKQFMAVNDIASAQKIILGELRTEFGGSARAYAQTFGGLYAQVKNLTGDVMEDLGKGFADEFAPILKDVKAWIENNRDAIVEFGRVGAEALGSLFSALSSLVGPLTWTLDKVLWIVDKIKYIDPSVMVNEEIQREMDRQGPAMAKTFGALNDAMVAAQKSAMDGVRRQVADAIAAVKSAEAAAQAEELKRIEEVKKASDAAAKARKAARDQELKDIDALTKSFYGVKETLVDQVQLHIQSAEKLGITGNAAERLKDLLSDARLRQTLEEMPDAAQDAAERFADMVPPIKQTIDASELLKDGLGDVVDKSEKIREKWQGIANGIGGASDILGSMGNLMGSLGLGALGDTLGQLGGIAGSASDMAADFASGNIVGGIAGAIDTLAGAVDFLGGIFGWNGNGVDDAVRDFDRMGVSISENIVEQIKAAKEAGEDAGVAMARLADQIIQDGELTAENMAGYKRLINDIFMQFDNGRMSMTEATNELGDAFVALAEKAEDAGLAGSKALADILNDARNRGMVSGDMMAYVDSARQAGLDAMSAHIAGTSTSQQGFDAAQKQMMAFFDSMMADGKSALEIIDAMGPAIDQMKAIGEEKGFQTGYLSDLLGLREFVEDNKDVITGIQATQSVMDSMAKSGILTQERFTEFAASAYDYYKQLTSEGKNGTQAIQALLPMLGKQLWYAQEYGFELDENTKKLIEEAKAQGMKLDAAIPAEERMAAGIEKLVALFEKLTGGVESTTSAIQGMGTAFAGLKIPAADFMGTGEEYTGFAVGTSGYQRMPRSFYVHRDERIDVGPSGTMRVTPQGGAVGNAAGSGSMNITLTLPNVRDPYSVRQLKEDLLLNRDGIQKTLRQVVH